VPAWEEVQAFAGAQSAPPRSCIREKEQSRSGYRVPCDSAQTASIGGVDDALLLLLDRDWTRPAPDLALPLSR
jgi:hypothetical protein